MPGWKARPSLPYQVSCVPVVPLSWQEIAALEQQDALAGRREPIGERAAAGAGADNDHVITFARRWQLRTQSNACAPVLLRLRPSTRRGTSMACSLKPQFRKMQRRWVMWLSLAQITPVRPVNRRYASTAISMPRSGAEK